MFNMFNRGRSTIVVWTMLVALVGCGDDQTLTGPGNGGDDAQTATVTGSVESAQQTASAPVAAFGLATTPSRQVAGEASSVAVAAVSADGSLDVLAEAEIQSDGRFTIEGVPAGRGGLVVSARGSNGAEVGRALVHGETEAGATTVTEPVTGETTVQGLVYSRLTAAGVSEEIRNTARLALLIRMEQATAEEVAASATSIQAVADAYRAGAKVEGQVFAAAGTDRGAQLDALIEAARQHAESRDGGTRPDVAQDAFIDAALEAFARGGANSGDISLATSAGATGLDQAGAVAHENARLDLARNAVELNLAARQKLVADMDDSNERSAAAAALAEARIEVRASASVADVARALADAEAGVEQELTSMILARLPSQVPLTVRTTIESRLAAAFAQANLSASLRGLTDVNSIVQAALAYRDQVRSAVDAFVAELPSGLSVDAEVTADLLVALRGGPAIGPAS